jgi:hypothetical protein
MQLFVFSIKQCRQETLINATAIIYQLKVLVGAGEQLWEDDDAAATISEADVRRDYLEPNNIPVVAMGKMPAAAAAATATAATSAATAAATTTAAAATTPRFWVMVDSAKMQFDDFYTYDEALDQHIFDTDSSALCWKTYYIFLNADDKSDIIGNSNYIGRTSLEAIQYVLANVV